jgi:hypothetical protein
MGRACYDELDEAPLGSSLNERDFTKIVQVATRFCAFVRISALIHSFALHAVCLLVRRTCYVRTRALSQNCYMLEFPVVWSGL